MELAAHAVVWQALVAAWRGEQDECLRLTERARAITLRHPMVFVEDAIRWVDGVLELGFGQAPKASTHLRAIVHPVIMNAASLDGVEAAIFAGDLDEAERWMRWLTEAATLSDTGWARARLAHGQALLAADHVEAEGLFATALYEHSQGNRRFERARTELAYGSFLRRQRRRVDARSHLWSALTTFDELGAVPWADRTQAELRASGETARRREANTTFDLTPQEVQVASFVTDGMTNREVAAQMFLGPRTIDYHLRSVFTKLGIKSRTELANRLAEASTAGSNGS